MGEYRRVTAANVAYTKLCLRSWALTVEEVCSTKVSTQNKECNKQINTIAFHDDDGDMHTLNVGCFYTYSNFKWASPRQHNFIMRSRSTC